MSIEVVTDVMRDALIRVLIVSAPVILVAMIDADSGTDVKFCSKAGSNLHHADHSGKFHDQHSARIYPAYFQNDQQLVR